MVTFFFLFPSLSFSLADSLHTHRSQEFNNFIGCCLQKDTERRWNCRKLLEHPFLTSCDANEANIVHLMQTVNDLATTLLAEEEDTASIQQTALKTARGRAEYDNQHERQQIVQQQLRELKNLQKAHQEEKYQRREEHQQELQKFLKKQDQQKVSQYKLLQNQEQAKKEQAEKDIRSQCEKRIQTELFDMEDKSSQKEDKGWKGLFTLSKNSNSNRKTGGTIKGDTATSAFIALATQKSLGGGGGGGLGVTTEEDKKKKRLSLKLTGSNSLSTQAEKLRTKGTSPAAAVSQGTSPSDKEKNKTKRFSLFGTAQKKEMEKVKAEIQSHYSAMGVQSAAGGSGGGGVGGGTGGNHLEEMDNHYNELSRQLQLEYKLQRVNLDRQISRQISEIQILNSSQFELQRQSNQFAEEGNDQKQTIENDQLKQRLELEAKHFTDEQLLELEQIKAYQKVEIQQHMQHLEVDQRKERAEFDAQRAEMERKQKLQLLKLKEISKDAKKQYKMLKKDMEEEQKRNEQLLLLPFTSKQLKRKVDFEVQIQSNQLERRQRQEEELLQQRHSFEQIQLQTHLQTLQKNRQQQRRLIETLQVEAQQFLEKLHLEQLGTLSLLHESLLNLVREQYSEMIESISTFCQSLGLKELHTGGATGSIMEAMLQKESVQKALLQNQQKEDESQIFKKQQEQKQRILAQHEEETRQLKERNEKYLTKLQQSFLKLKDQHSELLQERKKKQFAEREALLETQQAEALQQLLAHQVLLEQTLCTLQQNALSELSLKRVPQSEILPKTKEQAEERRKLESRQYSDRDLLENRFSKRRAALVREYSEAAVEQSSNTVEYSLPVTSIPVPEAPVNDMAPPLQGKVPASTSEEPLPSPGRKGHLRATSMDAQAPSAARTELESQISLYLSGAGAGAGVPKRGHLSPSPPPPQVDDELELYDEKEGFGVIDVSEPKIEYQPPPSKRRDSQPEQVKRGSRIGHSQEGPATPPRRGSRIGQSGDSATTFEQSTPSSSFSSSEHSETRKKNSDIPATPTVLTVSTSSTSITFAEATPIRPTPSRPPPSSKPPASSSKPPSRPPPSFKPPPSSGAPPTSSPAPSFSPLPVNPPSESASPPSRPPVLSTPKSAPSRPPQTSSSASSSNSTSSGTPPLSRPASSVNNKPKSSSPVLARPNKQAPYKYTPQAKSDDWESGSDEEYD
jgi:hypothetical protein